MVTVSLLHEPSANPYLLWYGYGGVSSGPSPPGPGGGRLPPGRRGPSGLVPGHVPPTALVPGVKVPAQVSRHDSQSERYSAHPPGGYGYGHGHGHHGYPPPHHGPYTPPGHYGYHHPPPHGHG